MASMLYAQVVVKKKTNAEELTYAVPAAILPYIQVGSLVTVPFRRGLETGIVVHLTSRTTRELKGKIREIDSLERGQTPFSQAQVEVIKRLADWHGASLAEIAFFALDLPAKSTSSAPKSPTFLQACLPDRLKFYQQLVKKYHGQRRLLFLFAQKSFAEYFFKLIKIEDDSIIHLDGRAPNRKKALSLYQKQRPYCLVATLKDAFWPLQANDLLIIDQPYHIGAKHHQRPFLNLKSIGLARAREEGLNLILADDLVKVEDYPRLTTRDWRLINKPLQPWPQLIFNRQGVRGHIVPGLLKEIEELVKQDKKILVLTLSRGWAPAIICSDCQQILNCPRCLQTIALQENDRKACRYCGFSGEVPKKCPHCESPNLQPIGEGTRQITDILEKHFPVTKVRELSSDQPETKPDSQIVVATEKIFSFPKADFEAVVLFNVDRLLVGSELDGHWQLLSFVCQLQGMAKKLIVQTQLSDHQLWSIIATAKLNDFFHSELQKRREFNLPPYGTILTVRGLGDSQPNLEKQFQAIQDELRQILPRAVFSELTSEGLGKITIEAIGQIYIPRLIDDRLKRLIRKKLPPAWHLDIS